MKQLTKKQAIAIGAIGILAIGGVTFAIVKQSNLNGVKTSTSISKSSPKKRSSSESSVTMESQQESTSQIQSSSQQKTTQIQASVDTKNLTENQFKQWVAIVESEKSQRFSPTHITISRSDDNLLQATLNLTDRQIDSVNFYKLNDQGQLEVTDYQNYPSLKVISEKFPEINQKKLTTNQLELWIVAVEDALFNKSGVNPNDVLFDLETSSDGVKVYKMNQSASTSGGATDATRTLINEFRMNSAGNLETKEMSSGSYYLISDTYMDSSMVQ